MSYARIHENKVAEICAPVPGFTIEQCFHVDLVDKMVPCGDDVQPGWFYESATGRFSETGEFPPIEVPEPPLAPELSLEPVVEETPVEPAP